MTYIHKVKCLHCSLHFQAFSWETDWRPVVCPECKTKFDEVGGYLHWKEQTQMQIFEFVPGQSGGAKSVGAPHPNDAPPESADGDPTYKPEVK
jgi:hypothetical protein